jgi:predicted transcriptional regulator
MASPRQIRAARALLDWSQPDLAREAHVSAKTVSRIEAGVIPRSETVFGRVLKALTKAGIECIEVSRSKGEGVRFSEPADEAPSSITPAQIRCARILLGWSQRDLAEHAIVAPMTVNRIEKSDEPKESNPYWAIVEALQDAGVELIASGADGKGEGVRLSQRQTKRATGQI